MLLAKSIIFERRNTLRTFIATLLIFSVQFVFAQDNSPYSRYGLGDVVPNTNIVNRAMGGITAGYGDFLSINFNNPASFSQFQTLVDKSAQPVSGRVLLDVGVNIENRTLRSPNRPEKFTSSNALFSYLHIGVPLRKNWGLSFGLKPLSRISYEITRNERLKDPSTGLPIDSAYTEFSGNGGSYLPSIGTGFAIKNFSVGVNVGYLFGRRESTTKRALINDSVSYNNSNHTSRSTFGDLFFNAGAQYKIEINKKTFLRLGASGNVKQTLNGSQEIIRETFLRDANTGDRKLDSVFQMSDIKGEVIYPSNYTFGFVVEHQTAKGGGWLLGVDYVQNKWDDFRFFGTNDAVQNSSQVRLGGHFRPEPGRSYTSNIVYRAGFFTGPDYIRAAGKLPQFGASFGVGLPIANYNRSSLGQYSIINVTLEYNKRGNNDNLLKENTFRFSVGLNFSDLWFNKRKYD